MPPIRRWGHCQGYAGACGWPRDQRTTQWVLTSSQSLSCSIFLSSLFSRSLHSCSAPSLSLPSRPLPSRALVVICLGRCFLAFSILIFFPLFLFLAMVFYVLSFLDFPLLVFFVLVPCSFAFWVVFFVGLDSWFPSSSISSVSLIFIFFPGFLCSLPLFLSFASSFSLLHFLFVSPSLPLALSLPSSSTLPCDVIVICCFTRFCCLCLSLPWSLSGLDCCSPQAGDRTGEGA